MQLDETAMRAMNISPLVNKPGIVTVEAIKPENMVDRDHQIVGFFGRERYEGDRFQIATWREFTPVWMRFVDPIPKEWEQKLKERDGVPAKRATGKPQKPQTELLGQLCAVLPAAEDLADQMQFLHKRDCALVRAQDAILGGVDPTVHGFANAAMVREERVELRTRKEELHKKLRNAMNAARPVVLKAGLTLQDDPDPTLILSLRTLIRAQGYPIPGRAA